MKPIEELVVLVLQVNNKISSTVGQRTAVEEILILIEQHIGISRIGPIRFRGNGF